MTTSDRTFVRKVWYGNNGFTRGVLLPVFEGPIGDAYDLYSKKWFDEHCDKVGNIRSDIAEKDVDNVAEFTVTSDDHFFVGLNGTYAYEAIDPATYFGYPGMARDQYGFELMVNSEGKIVPYDETIATGKSDL